MTPQLSGVLPALRQMFPALPDDILLAALEAHGNSVEGAIVLLLEMSAGGENEGDALGLAEMTPILSTRERRQRTPYESSMQLDKKKLQASKVAAACLGKAQSMNRELKFLGKQPQLKALNA